MIRWNFET